MGMAGAESLFRSLRSLVATANAGTVLRLMRLGATVACFILLVVSILWAGAGVAASASESSPSLLEKRDKATVQLPGGMDPMDVVRMVHRNGAHMSPRAASLRSAAGGHELPVNDQRAPADGVGAAFNIGGAPVYGPTASVRYKPAIASDGTNYLVVWEDWRSGSEYDIYGARVSAAGSVLDSGGIAISTAANYQATPSVAFDGTNYLVVWEDYRSGSDYDIYGARVSASGSVLDTAGIAISTAANDQATPAIAFDGANYLVVWEDWRSVTYSDIYGTRVSTSGSVLDTAGIAISTAANDQELPSIAFGTTNYLVVWADLRNGLDYNIYGARVSTTGSVLDATGIAISTAADDQHATAVAFGGSNYLVVWDDLRSGSYADIYGARVSTTGSVLDATGIAISTVANDQATPSIAFDGTNYLVAWEDWRGGADYDIYGARVSAGGSVLDATGIAMSTAAKDQMFPRVAFAGTTYLVVWEDGRSGLSFDIYGTRVSEAGSVLDATGTPISFAATDQYSPAIAFDGTNYLVVWYDYRGGSDYDIYGARVSTTGNLVDGTAIAISTAAGGQYYPAVAFDGTNYLVVWADYRNGSDYDVYGARVSTGGTVLDTAGIAISTAASDQYWPAIAFGGTNYLVVWVDWRNGSDYDVYGARVSTGGSVLDAAGIAISTATNDQYWPAIAFDGTNYLVAWADWRSGSTYDIYGTRVSAGGSVLDATGIAISTAQNDQEVPAIAFGGANYLVVWADDRGGSDYDIYGTRVSLSGSVLDAAGIAISTATNDQYFPAPVFDGTSYFVTWDDRRGSSYDIYGARLTPGGVLVDASGLVISAAAYNQWTPAVCRGTTSTALIAYTSFTPAPYGSYRIWGDIWHNPTAIAFATASATAEQGHVTLSWQMAVDATSSSFRVERSETVEGDFVALDLPISMDSGDRFSCTDYSVQSGMTYWYKIVLAGASGGASGGESYGPIEVHVAAVPVAYALHHAYPNPFNPVCTIGYDVPRACRVRLRVFDVGGSPVRTLVDGWREPGAYSEIWNGRADGGAVLPSGVYLYRLEADGVGGGRLGDGHLGGGDFVATRKIVMLR